MRFGVLGPVAVADDAGRIVGLRSAKQRRLLALLLSAPGHTASVDRLIDGVWDGSPPPSTNNRLQVYILRLRRALGQDRIAYHAQSYTLRVEPGELDAAGFEDLAGRGREALADNDFELAAELLGQAEALWRDEPYGGVEDCDPVRREADRLLELRRGVLEDRIDADLALGRHAVVLAELTVLAAEHPLRERLRGQQMLALYRSGRSADALEVYRDLRRTLVDELGLEPGAELRRLEQAILTEDPSLAAPAGTTHPARTTPPARVEARPAELPAGAAAFTGRTDELAGLVRVLREPRRADHPLVLAISGPGGVGKSTLALEAAHAVADRYPDGQVYVNLRGATPGVERLSALDALGRVLRALGLDDRQVPADTEEAAARLRSLTAGRRLLIVLDDAAEPGQVRPVLPGHGSPSAVLVTSRPALATLDPAMALQLDAMTPDEAAALFARLVGADRVAAEPEPAADIVRLCGSLPLALRIAGARLASRADWSLATFAERLGDETERLDELEYADLAVRAGCSVSRAGLTGDAGRLFDLLGVVDLDDVTAPVVAALADRRVATVQRDLDRLVDAQLLRASAGRYELHDLVRLYARERAAGQLTGEQREAAVHRVLRHYVATARAATRRLRPSSSRRLSVGVPDGDLGVTGVELGDGEATARWVRGESVNLPDVARLGPGAGDEGAALTVALAVAVAVPCSTQASWNTLSEVSTLALQAAGRSVDPTGALLARHDLAVACLRMGRIDEAARHSEANLAEARRLQDREIEALALTNLGNLATRQRWFEAAERHLRDLLALHQETGDLRGQADTLNNLGNVYLLAERTDDASGCLRRCLEIHAGLDEPYGKAMALGNLGDCAQQNGDLEQALGYYEQSARICHAGGYTLAAMQWSWDAGVVLRGLGRDDEARTYWGEAVAFLTEIGAVSPDEAAALATAELPQRPAALRPY